MDTAQANALQAILQHDDSSTDTQLIEYFIAELEISPVEACRAVLNRQSIAGQSTARQSAAKNVTSEQEDLQHCCIQADLIFSSPATNHGAPL
jgi:hypothetical protein